MPKVRAFTDRQLEKIAGRLINKGFKNSVMLLDTIGRSCIAQVRLKEIPDEYTNKALKDMDLRSDKNILVTLITVKPVKENAWTDTVSSFVTLRDLLG